MIKILFVCMGNICRSPTAEGVLRHFAGEHKLHGLLEIDSAGTIGFHSGSPPDARAIAHASERGYDLTQLRARQINQPDYDAFDFLLAMDRDNLAWLKKQCPSKYHHKLKLFLDFSEKFKGREVPDPYYGNAKGFDVVLDMAEDGSRGLIAFLLENELRHLKVE